MRVAALFVALTASVPAMADLVGTLPGKFTTTPAGGASYSLPLELPPGIAGMTPALAIQYSSGTPDFPRAAIFLDTHLR